MSINLIIGLVIGFAIAAYIFNVKTRETVNNLLKGKKSEQQVCTCGQKLKSEWSNCPKCGKSIK